MPERKATLTEPIRSHVHGLSHLNLSTSSLDKYYSTIQFYTKLGFEELLHYDKDSSSNSNTTSTKFNKESHKEAWLTSFGQEEGIDITLKIRFKPSSSEHENIDTGCAFSFYATKLNRLIEIFTKDKIEYSQKSDDELECFDPIGTLVTFTSRPNPYSQTTEAGETIHTPRSKYSPKRSNSIDTVEPDKSRKIGVLTSGGDAPGMNAAVRAVVRMTIAKGCTAYAIYEGYEGLVHGGKMIKKMAWPDVRGWLSEGGTLIGTARSKSFMQREGRQQAAKNLITNGIDSLVIIGGDGSLTGADTFRSEWPSLVSDLLKAGDITKEEAEKFKHLYIVGMVGSIDNDMSSTDMTIGALSSLHRICEAVDSIASTAFSHSRAFVVEVMGRHCGWLAVMAGISTGADFVFIPERPVQDGKWQEEMTRVIKRHRGLGKRKTIIIVAEGAIDTDLNPVTPSMLKDLLSTKLGLDTRVTTLGHTQRGGLPCAFDRILATTQGVEAVDALLESTPETPSPMIGINENKITRRSLMESVKLTHQVAEAISKKDFGRAMELRDPEFAEYWDAYIHTTVSDERDLKVPEEERMRIGIIHIGAPAGGMNAATRAAVRYCLNRGHTPLALHNGFPGLVRHDAVRELSWADVDGWAMKGGSEIGTNRDTPSLDYGMVAWEFQKHRIQALMIIGGFEAYTALSQLYEARKNYPAFRIPLLCLPSTISNNVPGTEFAIGTDTAVNSIVNYCDSIKQSADASRRRVFVVEVQGGRCGYLASVAGLATGALAVYTPEEGINLQMLARDVENMRKTFANDQGMSRSGKIVLRNEKASETFTTEVISSIIRDEAKKRFEARTAIPGHIQQGGVTISPLDRVRAHRLAVKCIQNLEEGNIEQASVIGIEGTGVIFTPINELTDKDTDFKNRRPRVAWWNHYKDINDVISGRRFDIASQV